MVKYCILILTILLSLCFTTYSGLMTSLEHSSFPKNAEDNLPIGTYEVWLYDYPMADVQLLVASQVLAIKNRNPLNVKNIGINEPWKGQVGTDSQGHAVFSTFSYGIRAAALTLRSYALKYGINTIEGIISRFTEGEKLQVDKYILYLSNKLGVNPREKINMRKSIPILLRYMSLYECGVKLPESLFTPYDILAEMDMSH